MYFGELGWNLLDFSVKMFSQLLPHMGFIFIKVIRSSDIYRAIYVDTHNLLCSPQMVSPSHLTPPLA